MVCEMALNPLAGRKTVTYDFRPRGDLHEQVWLSIAFSGWLFSPHQSDETNLDSSVDGVEYGRGEGLTKADAKEKASMNAYMQYMRNQGH